MNFVNISFASEAVYFCIYRKHLKVKFSRYKSGVAQRVGRDIAILFHDRGTRKG